MAAADDTAILSVLWEEWDDDVDGTEKFTSFGDYAVHRLSEEGYELVQVGTTTEAA